MLVHQWRHYASLFIKHVLVAVSRKGHFENNPREVILIRPSIVKSKYRYSHIHLGQSNFNPPQTATPVPPSSLARRHASATNLLRPQPRVELRVVGLDLPARIRAVQVARIDDIDTLDRASAQQRSPAEGDDLAGDSVDAVDLEADGGLRALAGLEGGLAGEGDRAGGVSGQEVDRVGGVGEVAGEEGLGVSGGVCRQELAEAVDEIAGGGVSEAAHGTVGGGRGCAG